MKTKHTRIGRTLIVAAVAGGLSTFAQEPPQVAPAPPPPAAPGAQGEKSNAPANPESKTTTLAWADRDFLQRAMELHTTGAELAKLAEKNAGTEEVQALGEELLSEHARSIAALREIARAKNAEANTGPTASQQAMITEFTGKLGHTFDEDYRAQAVSNHEQAIRLFTEAAKSKDPEIRAYAERTLGEMKEGLAELGGKAVKIKGSVASTLPKPAKSEPAEKTRSGKTKAPSAPTTVSNGTVSPNTEASTQQAAPTAQAAQAQPAPQQSPRRPTPRPMPVSHFVQNLDGTFSIVEPNDPRLTNPYAQPAANGQISAQTTMEVPTAQATSNSDPRALWRVPREYTEDDRRLARRPSMNVVLAGPSPSAAKRTTRGTTDDHEIASAPVARVVASNDAPRPAEVKRQSRELVSSDRPVTIIRRAPATRTFRIFNFDDD